MSTLSFHRTDRTPCQPLMAGDVMTPNPKSIDQSATVRDTAETLRNKGIHVAPVIDEAGRPIGIVSRTDLLDYWGRRRDRREDVASGELPTDKGLPTTALPGDELSVREIMMPTVFSVPINTPVDKVMRKLLALEVRNLFVTDDVGVLVGSISIFDLLRTLLEDKDVGKWEGD